MSDPVRPGDAVRTLALNIEPEPGETWFQPALLFRWMGGGQIQVECTKAKFTVSAGYVREWALGMLETLDEMERDPTYQFSTSEHRTSRSDDIPNEEDAP